MGNENGVKKLSIKLFGGISFSIDGVPITGFVSSKAQALLCYLVMNPRPHPRLSLASLLWSDMPETKALGSLRKALSNLHRLLGGALQITRSTACFAPEGPHGLDVRTFTSLIHDGIGADQPHKIELLTQAVGLYTGEFMEGFGGTASEKFEDWMQHERDSYMHFACHALHVLTEHHIQQRDVISGIRYAMRQLEIEPGLEEAYYQLMILLAMSGRRSAALFQYHRCEQAMRERLDVTPSAELTRLRDQIANSAKIRALID